MEKLKMKNKKGEITTGMLIVMVLSVMGFIVVLIVLFRLDILGLTDKEVCQNSVSLRGSAVGQVAIPLNCKTEISCLSKDGSCEQMTDPNIVKVKDSDEVYAALAKKMQDCWEQFGEGKVNYVEGGELESNLYCSICSQFRLDESLDFFNNNEIDKKQLYSYLATHGSGKIVGEKEQSILEYLVGIDKSKTIEDALLQNASSFGNMTIGKQYFVMMGAFTKGNEPAKWALGIGAAVGITIAAVGTGGLALPIILGIGATGGGYLLGLAVEGESGNAFLSPTIIEANSEDFRKLKCVSINTLS